MSPYCSGCFRCWKKIQWKYFCTHYAITCIQKVIEQAKIDHGVDLEIDKTYRYCVLSNRKKNYLGVTNSGKVDVKGLTGKKSHTPAFIKKLFFELLDVLSVVQTMEDFVKAKKDISFYYLEHNTCMSYQFLNQLRGPFLLAR